jgi:hypothetical protein
MAGESTAQCQSEQRSAKLWTLSLALSAGSRCLASLSLASQQRRNEPNAPLDQQLTTISAATCSRGALYWADDTCL